MDRRTAMSLLTLLLLVGILGGVWHSLSSVQVVSPSDVTRARMTVLRAQIILFARSNPLPASLAELPAAESPLTREDAWHHPILYRLNPDGSATLTSLGADNAPGGTNENADITLEIDAPASRPATTPTP